MTKEERYERAIKDLPKAAALAAFYGLRLQRRTVFHYQLKSPRGWLLNIYPGNQRLYADKNRKPPYIQMFPPWTLPEVVKAFGENEKERNDEEANQDQGDNNNQLPPPGARPRGDA